MPLVDGDLAGEDGGSAAVAFFDDFEEIVAGLGVDGLEGEVIEDKKLNAEQGPADAGVSAVAAGEGEIGEELVGALVEDGALVAAGLVAQGGRRQL